MRITVVVAPRSSKNAIALISEGVYKVKLTAAPVDGKANAALIQFLSEYFKVPKSKIEIVKGEKGKKKIIEVNRE